jgi:hypothetical protein
MRRTWTAVIAAALVAVMTWAPSARAGDYVVAQCSPDLSPGAPDAGFVASSSHYVARANCSNEEPGLQVDHSLNTGETGSVQGAHGSWIWTAPPGTYIVGGSVYSRLATEDGEHGYVAVSPDVGAGVAVAEQNDDQGHTNGVPAGNWRYLLATLECTQPTEGGRCVGNANGAHADIKQVRIELSDVVAPTLSVGGSLLAGGELHGPQTLEVAAADEGGGLAGIEVAVNGQLIGSENLSCNPLPGSLTSRMVPCPSSFSHSFGLETAAAPFHDGANTVLVCARDYAQTGTPNVTCHSFEVITDNLCPGSPVAGGTVVAAGFAGNHRDQRTISYRQHAVIRGRVRDGNGNPVAGAQVCVLGHTDLPGRPFHQIGTAQTNENGGFSFTMPRGPSRTIRVGYRSGAFETVDELALDVRAHVTLHVSRHRVRPHHRVWFTGSLSGPGAVERALIIRATVPGAKRIFPVRRAETDAEGHFRIAYAFAFSPPARFEFWAVAPREAGLPFVRGHSVVRYVRLLP